MVPIASLWLPILLSAVFVFLMSFLLHMLLPIHRNDFRKLPREDEVMAALRGFAIPPGDYMTPCAGGSEAFKNPAFLEKYKQGPVAIYTFMKGGTPSMAGNLVQWFLHSLVIGVFAAYVAGRALPAGAHYLQVFRFAGVTAYLAYAFALVQHSIWYHRSWATTFKYQVDGLLYALVTAGTFGWLWPK